MANIRQIEKEWIENFRNSPLVDKERGIFRRRHAHQLFYGDREFKYSRDFPSGFIHFYNTCDLTDHSNAIDKLIVYLAYIGIKIRKQAIRKRIEKFPEEFETLTRKCYHIFKALARYRYINIEDPYQDNYGDLYYLLQIESEESLDAGHIETELPSQYGKLSGFPNGYENDTIVKELFHRVENSNESFFITGKAGTGKSTFVHYFTQKSRKKVLITAFTGIAAINAGGQTIHSFFRLPLKPLMPEDEDIKNFTEHSQQYKIIQKIDTIIIDEVSMLRSDTLEAIDYSLRKNGGNPHKRFGGKQILFIGDIFQLPPVVETDDEVEQILFSEIYPSEYFFDSPSYKAITPVHFEFKKSHRQKNDQEFIEMLDEIRTCQVSEESIRKLNERHNPRFFPKLDEFFINLTTTNAMAEAENKRKLDELPFRKFSFDAMITGEFSRDRYPTARRLELKKNAQVILIKNDVSGSRWANGTIARIDFISDDLIEVRLQNGEIHKLERVTWENRKYNYDRKTNKIGTHVVGRFKQFPIKLAWAITIHKSQGLTFDNVMVDLGSGAFTNGQLYTGLSRCRTLEGLVLKRKIRRDDIIADRRIMNFHETLQLIDST